MLIGPASHLHKRPARIVAFSPTSWLSRHATLPSVPMIEATLCHFEKKSFKIGHKITPIPW